MKKRLYLAAGLLVVAAAISAPAAAFAVDDPYTSGLSSNTVAPGGTISYAKDSGQAPGTPGTASLTGGQPGATITAASYTTSTSFVVGAGGTINLNIKLPANASGAYSLSVAAGTFTDSQSFAVAVAAPSAPELSFTGFNAMPFIWFGGGLVVLGIGVIAVLTVVRRSRKPGIHA